MKEYVDMISEDAKKEDEDFAFRLEKKPNEDYPIRAMREEDEQPMEYEEHKYT